MTARVFFETNVLVDAALRTGKDERNGQVSMTGAAT